jgi:hypothetical protein
MYKPRESDGVNILNLIENLGGNPPAERQVPVITNIIRALYNFDSKFDDVGGAPQIFETSTSYVATDNNLIVIRNLTSDIAITLPASGSIWIKRMDSSNYQVTIVGTVDDVVNPTIEYNDGFHLVGKAGKFYLV